MSVIVKDFLAQKELYELAQMKQGAVENICK
jgi:hypothetical protein